MKKTKAIAVILLIALLFVLLLTVFVACDPKEQDGIKSGDVGNSGNVGGKEPDDYDDDYRPAPPPDDDKKNDNNNIYLSQSDFLTKIIESVEVPEKALNIDVSATVDTQDKLTTLRLQGNFYNEVKNELCFGVYELEKGVANEQEKLVFAIYIVSDKIYLDMADGSPLIYLSDFDFNYVLQILKGSVGLVGGLLDGLDSSITGLIGMVMSFIFDMPKVTVNADGSQSISMEILLKGILEDAGSLISVLPINIPIDIAPITSYIAGLIPDDQNLYINAEFNSNGFLSNVGVSGVDKINKTDKFDFSVTIDVRDIAEVDLGIPKNLDKLAITEFSFTNLQFNIDLVFNSLTDEVGHSKGFDLGKFINGFLGTSTTTRIPEGLLLLNGGTGIRLAFKLDLDLNYDKIPNKDDNKVAIELFLIHPDGTLVEYDKPPQIGIYYTEGSFYLNTDRMLPSYLNGLNVKLDASLADLLDMFVDLITDAIDGVFNLNFAGLRKSELTVNNNGSLTLANMSAVQKVLSSSNTDVVALKSQRDGSYELSAGIRDLVDAVANILGMGGEVKDGVVITAPNIYTDDTSIKVVVNNDFFDILGGLIPALKGVKLPEEVGDIVLSVNTSQAGIDSVTVDVVLNNAMHEVYEDGDEKITITTLDPAFAIGLSIDNFLIGFQDDTFGDYIDTRVNKESVNYLATLNSVIDHILGGIRFSSGLRLTFNAGTYDLAPFIAGFGISEVEASQILWTFDNDFILDASLNLQIALNRTDTAKSMIVLELKTEKGIKVGNHTIIEPEKVLFGIYGYNNNIYIDISNLNIFGNNADSEENKSGGIVLPKLSFALNFTDVVYTLLDNVIGDLLKQINVQGGDLKFELNFKELLGFTSSAVAQSNNSSSVATHGASTYAQTQEIDTSSAIILGFNTEKFEPVVSLASILAILSAANTNLGDTLAEALSLMKIDLSISMGRNDGFNFELSGDFIPKLDANGECVYYYDKDGNLLNEYDEEGKPVKKIYKNVKDKPEDGDDKSNVVYYTTKKYNYGSEMKLVFAAGTSENPVIVGNLGEYKYPIEEKSKEFEDFKSDLIEAIVNTVGRASINLDIDLTTLDNEMNITRIINNILASFGKKLELPISLDLDDWNAHCQLKLAWDLDLTRFSNSKILLELIYEQKTILGLYINRNSIILDLRGLGLFSGEIVNSTIVSKVFTMVDGLIKQIGDFDLTTIINDLLKNSGLPTVGTSTENSDKIALGEEVASDGSVATIGSEGLEIMDFVSYLTQGIQLKNTEIVIKFTSDLINGMLNDLVGLNLGLDLGADGSFDLFGDKMSMGLHVEDIFMNLELTLSIGQEVEIPIDFDEAPDWNAAPDLDAKPEDKYRPFVTTLLNTLDIGLTIDLANYTQDTVNLEKDSKGSTDNNKKYTRITIEKVTASGGIQLENVKGGIKAPQGSFLITLAFVNEAMYNNNQSASRYRQPLVHIILDHRKTSGQLTLAICSNLVSILGIDIGDTVGVQYINLDLVGMLAPVIDSLFTTIDGALDGLNSQTMNNQSNGISLMATNDEPEGIASVFAGFDWIKFLGEKGIMLSLLANGSFNVKVEFDPYLINKLIDDVLSWVFAKGTGHGSILDLSDLAPDMFKKDYLGEVVWTREIGGSNNNTNSFWGSLRSQLSPMIQNLLSSLGYGALNGLINTTVLGGVYTQVRKIISGLLPFAVWNTAMVEINVVDATISNIHFRGQDTGEIIFVDNDKSKPIAYNNNKDARRDGYFTELFIYNSSASVGESTANGENNGIVTWADIPTNVTFMPYIYKSFDDGVQQLMKLNFSNKVAIYQKGSVIMRANVQFFIEGQDHIMQSEDLEAILRVKGEYRLIARATFESTSGNVVRELPIDLDVRDYGGGLDRIEDIEMHAYDEYLPDFLTIWTKDGNSRKINTEYLTLTNWRPTTYEAHDVEATVSFANKDTLPLTIHYLDSTVSKIIIDGTEGKNVNVDLYEFNIEKSKIEDFTPETLFFKYADGKALGLDVLSGWNTGDATKMLFDRELDVYEDGNWYSTDVEGGRFIITTDIAAYDGAAPQTVKLTFVVKTKKVFSLTINDVVNKINIDPYKYYMYMIGESDENPFPSVVEAKYIDEYENPEFDENKEESAENSKTIKDEYDEDVKVIWKNLSKVVFDWNNNNDIVNTVDVALDNGAYPNSSFTWVHSMEVSVLRNEVEAIYFDEKLTQSALYIDPFQYLINGKGTANFPSFAYVRFTNGAVYRMPIAWKCLDDFIINPDRPAQFRQFEVVIGFDPVEYKKNGTISGYKINVEDNLLQTMYVNVQVENRVPQGIEIAGSELMGGTYYIDPVQVLYYGMNPFPSTVTVRYTSGKTSVLQVTDTLWKRNFEITMRGKSGLKATLQLNDEYSFDINVEIIDRNNLKSDLTKLSIDPYVYTTDERGNRVYDSYADNMNLYQSVGAIDLATFKVVGRKQTSGDISAQYKTFLKYVIYYLKDGKQESYAETNMDYIKDFIARNENITIVGTEVFEYFNVPITWNLNEVNYSIADTYTVRAIVKAKDSYFNKEYKVNVDVLAKKVKEIAGDVEYIMVDGTNLSETAKLTKKLVLKKTVVFEDDSFGSYEVTLDLTKIQYEGTNSATLRWSRDENGNQVITDLRLTNSVISASEVADCAMNIEVTVCSGDIAQTCTMKVHVLDNQM